MAITRIEFKAQWGANLERGPQERNYWLTSITRPWPDDQRIIAYGTPNIIFARAFGFEYPELSRALAESSELYLKTRYEGGWEADAVLNLGWFDATNANYRQIDTGQPDLSNVLRWYPDNTGEIEHPITDAGIKFEIMLGAHLIIEGYTEGLLFADVYEPTLVVYGNFTARRPDVNFPVGGIKQDRTKSLEFSWNHSGVYDQAEFELRYRKRGTTAWTTIKEEITENAYTLPPNTLTAGEYEWQVRTRMQNDDEFGPWSNTSIFNATEETNAPTITSPQQGEVIGSQNLKLTWEPIPNQDRYEINLIQNGRIVRTHTGRGTQNEFTFNWLENNQEYIVEVRLQGEGEIWSDWAQVNFSVVYTEPGKPTLSFIKDDRSEAVTVRIINPEPQGTQPNVTHQNLYRREQGETEWVLLAEQLPDNAAYKDFSLAANTTYEYQVHMFGDNDTNARSDVFNTSIKIKDAVIAPVSNPETIVRLREDPEKTLDYNYNGQIMTFAGRKKPVVEFIETIETSLSFSCLLPENELRILQREAAQQHTLLFRDLRGRKKYVAITNINIMDNTRIRDAYPITIAMTEVDYKEGI